MAVGAIAAAIVVGTLQPTVYMKNAMAQGGTGTLNPLVLYRGVSTNFGNEVGQLSLQFGATGCFKRAFPATMAGEISAAAVAGALVAAYASPCEGLMIQQQKHGGGIVRAARCIVQSHGVGYSLQRGLSMAMMRDAIGVGGMLGVTPVVHDLLVALRTRSSAVPSNCSEVPATAGNGAIIKRTFTHGQLAAHSTMEGPNTSTLAAISLGASMFGGALGSILSQPFDVLHTCMKGDLDQHIYKGVRDTLRKLVADGGISRLFRGGTWRCLNITATVWIANECALRLPSYVTAVTRDVFGFKPPTPRQDR